MALKERLSIIQGPPGTGKTLVVAAIAANWMKNIQDQPKVIVCAPSNTAADFIAERLIQIPLLQDKVIRFYPSKREDIFNLKLENIKPYTLMSKFLYMDNATQLRLAQEISPVDQRQQQVMTYLDYYFSDHHLMTNQYIN
jgi:Rad3-related DNA helicase